MMATSTRQQLETRLAACYGSSLPGLDDEAGEDQRPVEAVPAAAGAVEVAAAGGSPADAVEAGLLARIAHLDASAQATIVSLSRLQREHAVRCYESCDGLAAGIIAGETIRRQRPDVVRRAWELFFGPHHATICTLFEAELRAVARREGKVRAWPAGGGSRGR